MTPFIEHTAIVLKSKAEMDAFVPYDGISPITTTIIVLSLMTLLLDTPVMIYHVRNRNVPSSALLFWIIVSNFMNVINAGIWHNDDVENWFDGSGICDIEVKLEVAATGGLAGSVLCIMHALFCAFSTNRTSALGTAERRRRRLIFDLTFCLGPCIFLFGAHFIVQPSRYYIFAISGCNPSVDNSWPSIVLLFIPPCILCIAAGVYAAILIVRLWRYKREFSEILASNSSGLSKARFWRLFAVAFIAVFVVSALQFYALYENVSLPLHSYSWSDVHAYTWNEKVNIPTGGIVVFDRWIRIVLGFLVFFCFGFGGQITPMYKSWFCKIGLDRFFPSLKVSGLPRHAFISSKATTTSSTSSLLSKIRDKAISLTHYTFRRVSVSSSRPVSWLVGWKHPWDTNAAATFNMAGCVDADTLAAEMAEFEHPKALHGGRFLIKNGRIRRAGDLV